MAKRKTSTIITKPDVTKLKRDNDNFKNQWWRVEEYLRVEVTEKTLKKETVKWLKSQKKNTKPFNILKDWQFRVLGKLCYVLNHGGEIPPEGDPWMEKELVNLEKEGKEKLKQQSSTEKKKSSAPTKTIQDYLYEKAAAVCGEEFEGIVDEFIENPKQFKYKNYDPLTALRKNEITAAHARHVIKFYQPELDRIRHAVEDFGSKETQEYYGHYTKSQLTQLLKFYEKILDASNLIIDRAKAKRKTRKTKSVNPSKVVKNLKYLKEDSELGLASVNPADILGAKELWYYNSKVRKLGKYVALDSSGLSVKGTTIINYSVDKSVQKTLRKPKEQIKDFKSGGTRKLNKAFNEIKGVEIKAKSRLNSNIVIFRVFK